ncbi:MAG: DUF362 domain-containing protein [Acidobacteria bacterium]|nr:DUF362 domain-containing protein [Acidobacteriota bacterium]
MSRSRRHFLRCSGLSLLAAPIVGPMSSPVFRNGYAESMSLDRWRGRVVVARNSGYDSFSKNPAGLLDQGLAALLGTERGSDAWRRLFRREDVVAVKVNALAGPRLSPGWPLVQAVVDGLKTAGVPAGQIIVWDRSSRELKRLGYPVNTSGDGVKVFGTDALRQGYEETITRAGSVGSCFSRIIARYATAVINVGVLKDHDLAGISVLLKNFYGAIHNPNKYHDNNCSPYVAHVNSHPDIRQKLRLNIVDAPVGQYHGGPAFNNRYTWTFGGLLLAVDAVAADRVALDLIQRQRQSAGLRTLRQDNRYPAYIDVAGEMGLGEATLSAIRRIEV